MIIWFSIENCLNQKKLVHTSKLLVFSLIGLTSKEVMVKEHQFGVVWRKLCWKISRKYHIYVMDRVHKKGWKFFFEKFIWCICFLQVLVIPSFSWIHHNFLIFPQIKYFKRGFYHIIFHESVAIDYLYRVTTPSHKLFMKLQDDFLCNFNIFQCICGQLIEMKKKDK